MMRVLAATTAGAGHLGPMLPFAHALRDAGHEVVVTAPASFAAAVERAGFEHRPFADADPEAMGRIFATLPGLPPEEASVVVARDVFGRLDAQAALPGVEAIVDDWHPDLIIRDPSEFASVAVAEARGIPHVRIGIGLYGFEDSFLSVLDEPLLELSCADGVARMRAAPRLTLLPESFEDPAAVGPASMRRFRDNAAAVAHDPLPDWWVGSSDPLVYITFGSVAANLPFLAGLYEEVVAAVAERPMRVLLTTGEGADLDGLGTLPPNVHVERWWPQQQVMAHASAMVGHGGFGTTYLGLAAGMPMVVVPLFADQPHNARRVAEVGAGIALEGGVAAIAGGLGPAIEGVLGEPSFRTEAERMAADIGALAPVADSVPVMEALAR
ncbi:MAG: glycosyltransferase [Acidimicrobiales bacterium]